VLRHGWRDGTKPYLEEGKRTGRLYSDSSTNEGTLNSTGGKESTKRLTPSITITLE